MCRGEEAFVCGEQTSDPPPFKHRPLGLGALVGGDGVPGRGLFDRRMHRHHLERGTNRWNFQVLHGCAELPSLQKSHPSRHEK